jgi:hypothetical protein
LQPEQQNQQSGPGLLDTFVFDPEINQQWWAKLGAGRVCLSISNEIRPGVRMTLLLGQFFAARSCLW